MRHRPRHLEEEEGEGYFASVSDLMVGILFVFLLMLTVFALNFRQAEQEQLVKRQELEAALAALKQQKEETAAARTEAERQRVLAAVQAAENQQLRAKLRSALRLLQ